MYTSLWRTILKDKSSKIINVIHVKINAMWLRETFWKKHQTTLLFICKGCASIMINLKTKKSTQDMSSLVSLMFMIIQSLKKKVSPNKMDNLLINWEELSFTMEPLILATISAIFRKAKTHGFSSTMRESESLIQTIFS